MTLLTSSPNAQGILPPEFSSLITRPVEEAALARDARLATAVSTSSHEFRIPVLVEDAAAAWVAEGAEISPSDPQLDEITVTPSKIAGLSIVSREVANDSSPSAQQFVGESLARAIILQLDRAFVGALPAPAAQGLGSITPTVLEGDLANLDVVHEAKAASAAEGGTPSAVLANPADVLKLATLKDADGSNRALVEDVTVVAGLPVVSSRHVEAGKLWVVDSSQVITVLREDVELAVSADAYFSSDRIALRATLRAGFAFPRPEALVRVDLAG